MIGPSLELERYPRNDTVPTCRHLYRMQQSLSELAGINLLQKHSLAQRVAGQSHALRYESRLTQQLRTRSALN